jgi:hypothetical protein
MLALSFRSLMVPVLLLSMVCSLACATSSKAELTTTSSQSESGFSTDITSIDGKPAGWGSISLEPGRHTVEVIGTSRRVGINASAGTRGAAMGGAAAGSPAFALGAMLVGWADATHSLPIKACFIARAGRTYEVRTYLEGGYWQIQVVDQTTTYDVKSPCKRPISQP